MKYELVIKNGTLVTSSISYGADLAVENGKIAAIGQNLEGKRTIDAEGKLVTPGAIDTHVHLEMPIGKYVSSDDFYTGTIAAAFGGTTSIIDFVESEKNETLIVALDKQKLKADQRSIIDYSFHMTIGPDDIKKLDQIPSVLEEGCQSFKLYMAYGLKLNDSELLKSLDAIAKAGGLAVVHAENWDVITTLIEKNIKAGRKSPHWHPRSRPETMEAEAVGRVISIADLVKARIHIFHVSCPQVIEKVTRARAEGSRVTAETCPQYLFLTQDIYDKEGIGGALAVCSPPLRSESSRQALWQHLSRGHFHTISTDHCPFCRSEKEAGMASFNTIAGGVPSIEMRFPALYSEGVRTKLITENQWVDLCCTGPAKLFGLKDKGDLAVGKDADIVIFDPEKKRTIKADNLHETAGWTPYEGLELTGQSVTTISRGEIIVGNGEFTGQKGRGLFIHR